MVRSLLSRPSVVAAMLALAIPFAVTAQTKAKPPPRLPANASETSRIPAGVDTGSPTTSDSLELGTPVPPATSVDRSDQSAKSAAARAAARPKAAASAGDCTNRLVANPPPGDGKAKPVALPGTGFTGSSTPPAIAAQTTVARSNTRLDC